jgi:hypothetical protein
MNADTIIDAIGDIDEELYDRSAKNLRTAAPKAKAKALVFSSKHVLRIAIAAALVIVIGVGLMLTSSAKGDVLPPARWGKITCGIGDNFFDISKSKEENPFIVCIVTVGNRIGETPEITFYQAHVERTLEGEIPEDFILSQSGCSEWNGEDFPLFVHGDRLMVFLTKYQAKEFNVNMGFDEFYSVNCKNLLIEATAKDGKDYVIDYFPENLSYQIMQLTDIRFTNHADDAELMSELHEDLKNTDPVYEARIRDHEELYYSLKETYEDLGVMDYKAYTPSVYSVDEIAEFFASR